LRPASTAFFASRPAATITLGLEVLVQDVMAAMSTSPLPMLRSGLSGCCGSASRMAAASVGLLAFISVTTRVPPSPGPGLSGALVERDALRVVDLAGERHAVEALRLEVRLQELDLAGAAARSVEVLHGLVVDREKAHRGAVLRCHVGERRAVGHRQACGALAE